jgi:signal transduction histidine kinase
MTSVTGRGLAYGVLALSLGCAVAGRVLVAASPPLDPGDPDGPFQIALETVWLGYGVLGALILGARPRHPIGWVLLGSGAAIGLAHLGSGYAALALGAEPDLPGAAVALWLPSTMWAPALVAPLVFVPLLFPDGKLPGPRWRPWAWLACLVTALWCVGFWFADGPLDEPPGPDNPFGVPGADLLQFLAPALLPALGLGVAAVVVRRRRAAGEERDQLRWLVLAGGIIAGCAVLLGFAGPWGPVPAAITLVAVAVLPVAVTVAITRYRLADIDLVINRTLVYGGLTGAVLAAYALVVLVAGRILGADVEWRQSVLVTAFIAMAAYPLHGLLQRAANRLMYGDRDDPYAAMSRLAQRLADAVTPAALLEAVADTVAQTLRLPYVAVELAGLPGDPAAAHGHLDGEPHRIPLVHQGEPVGTLVLGPRSPGERFSPADLNVLGDVARQAAVAAHAVRLAEDLQRARERLVLAREEERRRLRRDLHDGVGSALAGMTLYAGNARRALDGELGAAVATEWLDRLETRAAEAVADIRRVVHDLRPPALDELGVAGAIRSAAGGLPLTVELVAAEPLPPLSAAVEVAAYRIAVEALTNAVRHAEARNVTVHIAVGDAVRVEIADDGRGLDDRQVPGVGLISMRERAEELGGTCTVLTRPEGGVTVRAVLPVHPRPS